MACPLYSILLLHIALIIISQSPFVSSQNNTGKFSVGQSLLAKSNATAIVSPAGDFAFGFHQLSNSSDSLFLLSIWYAKIPDTIVWYVNDTNPVPQGSKLTITAGDGLILSDPTGAHLWNTSLDSSSGTAVSYGFMNDTGNFMLRSSINDIGALWESFKFPTDTLLPSQVLEIGTEVNCRVSESNFTPGRFQLLFQHDGNLILYTRDVPTDKSLVAYYASNTSDNVNPGNVGKQVVYSETGGMYVLVNNGSKVSIMSNSTQLVSTKDYYQRVRLHSNGVLNWYYYPKASTGNSRATWHRFQSLPDNICDSILRELTSGACGFNSICTIDDNHQPTCNCPPHYSLMDSDPSGSCKPDFVTDDCENFEGSIEDEYELIQLENTNFPTGDYTFLTSSGEESCMNSCLSDCFCGAVMLQNSVCWKKRLPLTLGKQGSWVQATAWLKVGSGNATNDQGRVRYKRNPTTTGMLGASAAVIFILVAAIALTIFFYHRRKQSTGNGDHQTESLLGHNSVQRFPYRMLESATDGFSEEVGRGSFGVVYKGTIAVRGNSTTVAVKKLDRTFMGADKEFTAEVNAIALTHHKNLVRFIGYCKEDDDKRLLVYEYMPNGTVADYLFSDTRPSWLARINIAQGVARGLFYLHEECTTQIIHCDIKPQNILVDDHYNARISDFGLAKLLILNQSQTNTAVRGTKGYVAPEWFRNKPISVKVDVYSFGVLLLEIVCCRRCVCLESSAADRMILTDWTYDCYQSGNLDSLVKDDMEALNDMPRLERFVKIGLWCIQDDPNLRPTMLKVNQMLEGVAEVPNPPFQSSFSVIV